MLVRGSRWLLIRVLDPMELSVMDWASPRSFYIVKARTTTAANSWRVYHSALGNTKQLFLEGTLRLKYKLKRVEQYQPHINSIFSW
jgi:hypothetical protein